MILLGFPRASSTSLLRRCHTAARTFTASRLQRARFSTANPSTLGASEMPEKLAGTAPVHRCYAFLHTHQPPSAYPAKYTTPVQRKLLLATAPLGVSVNFAWTSGQEAVSPEAETHRLTAFSSTRGKLETEMVSLANVHDVAEAIRAHTEPRDGPSTVQLLPDADSGDIHLYVCTHGARDCRCGDMGGAVARAIRDELDKRRQCQASDPSTRIKLAEVAHVGGHKYAANLLVYPHGEWLGLVTPKNVPDIINAILARQARPMHAEDMPICPSHWRGRMGLSKEEQMQLFERVCKSIDL